MAIAGETALLPSVRAQATRLLELGVHELAREITEPLRMLSREAEQEPSTSLLAVHPRLVPSSALAPLLRRGDRPGFVVVDMADVDLFTPREGIAVPDSPLYFVDRLDRGDEMVNWSPDEALPAISEKGRTPLLISEGVHWLLQAPEVLERNRCCMTIGSRLRKPDGQLDARTPAIWISGGTGRDGRERRDAPKVGWCWAGNRHTWLGFASASASRFSPSSPARTVGKADCLHRR